jgi:hypothetical protein
MKSNTEDSNLRWLKEYRGSECKSCEKFYSIGGMRKCPDCGKPMELKKWYTRLCIERITFIPTLMIVIFALSFLSNDPEAHALPLVVPAVYVLANVLLGVRFKET